jgi:hypothetical protein
MPIEGKRTDARAVAEAAFEAEAVAPVPFSLWRPLVEATSWVGRQFIAGLAAYGAVVCMEFSHVLHEGTYPHEPPDSKRKARENSGASKVDLLLHADTKDETQPLTHEELVRLDRFLAELRHNG